MEKKERLQKIIANRGFCSRRNAEDLISQGRVVVDGKIAKIGDSATQDVQILVNNTIVAPQEHRYIIMNKPKGVECTTTGKHSILRLVPYEERLYPIGRLDMDARGLILLTTDGEFAQGVIHPKHNFARTYEVVLDKRYDKQDTPLLNKGVRLKDGKVSAKVRVLAPKKIQISLTSGRKHIVKRLLFKLGYYVKDLKRVALGPLKLTVKEGKHRPLTKRELHLLRGE